MPYKTHAGLTHGAPQRVTVQIGPQYTLKIPEEFRSQLRVEQQVAICMDTQARSILDETCGMWADRADLPKSGVKYYPMTDIRFLVPYERG